MNFAASDKNFLPAFPHKHHLTSKTTEKRKLTTTSTAKNDLSDFQKSLSRKRLQEFLKLLYKDLMETA